MQPVVRLDLGRGRRPVTVRPVLPSVRYEIHTLARLCHQHAAKVIHRIPVIYGFYQLWLKNTCGFTFVSCFSTCGIWFRVLAVFCLCEYGKYRWLPHWENDFWRKEGLQDSNSVGGNLFGGVFITIWMRLFVTIKCVLCAI